MPVTAAEHTTEEAAKGASAAVLNADVTGTSWYIDSDADMLVISVDSRVSESEVRTLSKVAHSHTSRVRIQRVSGKFRPLIMGGDTIHHPAGSCSLGFNVRSGEKYYLVTAGHCVHVGDPLVTSSDLKIGPTVESSFPGDDYAVAEYSDSSVPHPGKVNLYNNSSQNIVSSGDPEIAQYVKRSGATTGLRSGQIIGLNATVNYGDEWGIVTGLIHTNICAEGGDSGGPLFSGSMALGVLSGASGDCTDGGATFYQPINEALRKHSLNISLDGCASIAGGKVCYQPYGDKFILTDTAGDGAHPELSFTSGGTSYTCSNTAGTNTSKTCDYDFPESQTLSYYLSIYDGSDLVRRGTIYYDRF
ncbi:S1 family peptidase [Streptomyces sp. NBC_01304]|uniref:S1 family peptidase n=1 Tax=Streptomyces sp. NBC_01304 TaxID=2903818 RepID=UPI002E12E6E0